MSNENAGAQAPLPTGGDAPVLILMPGLCGTDPKGRADAPVLSGLKRLWPGLPRRMMPRGCADAYEPSDLPCTPPVMAAYVADCERFAAESARSGGDSGTCEAFLSEFGDADRQRLRDEIDAVGLLSNGRRYKAVPSPDEAEHRRVKAQQVLGWLWMQERNVREVSGLVAEVNGGTETLDSRFSWEIEHDDEGLGSAAREFATAIDASLAELLPDWRTVLACAMRLLPSDTVFVAEGRMADDVRSSFELAPASDLDHAAQAPEGTFRAAYIPTGELLGAYARKGSWPVAVRVAVIEDA